MVRMEGCAPQRGSPERVLRTRARPNAAAAARGLRWFRRQQRAAVIRIRNAMVQTRAARTAERV